MLATIVALNGLWTPGGAPALRGISLDQLNRTHAKGMDAPEESDAGIRLRSANFLWAQKELILKPEFVRTLRNASTEDTRNKEEVLSLLLDRMDAAGQEAEKWEFTWKHQSLGSGTAVQ